MPLQGTLDRIPGHLRQYVVQQDYGNYDALDQAVWRFTLLQTFNQLRKTAHASYVEGLNQTGIYLDRIPKIEEMNQCLAEFGWGAVCVNGFIPPRAFQEFQALEILTINAQIRRAENLSYTPAPDIIHEAAGHAPIIPDPIYRKFLRKFGEVGKLAFSSKEDLAVYRAIKSLSEIKERRGATEDMVNEAYLELLNRFDEVVFTSEAAFLSRLHWWTVEYGLIGKPDDYKIYGAGILSSVGESMMLHLPEVKKMRLRARCVETDYDITEQQPQLYVVEDFEKLNEILDQVVSDFAFNVGGKLALQRAAASGEVGTVQFNSGLQITGILNRVLDPECVYLTFEGPCALAFENRQIPGYGREEHPNGYGTPLGRLEDGTALSRLSEYDLGKYGYKGPGSQISLRYQSGVLVKGNLDRVETNRDGYLMVLKFSNCRVTRGKKLLFDPAWGSYDLGVGEAVPTAFAGAADLNYWPETEFSEDSYPKPKHLTEEEATLLALYQDHETVWEQGVEEALPVFQKAADRLERDYTDHWLLHWNMLEKLTRADRGLCLASRLKATMLEIEKRDFNRVPVTVGLKYLNLA